ALDVDIPPGGTIQGYGVKFYPPGTQLSGQNERSTPVVMQNAGEHISVVWPANIKTQEPVLPLPASSIYARRLTMVVATDLSKRFGGFLAVNRVSFEVREGEIVGLIGPNGSGKSTTFNLIAGTLRPTAGAIRFRDEDITGLPAHAICHRGIARTFQIPRPFRKLSLIDNVTLAAYYGEAGRIGRDEARRRAEE